MTKIRPEKRNLPVGFINDPSGRQVMNPDSSLGSMKDRAFARGKTEPIVSGAVR